MTTVKKLVIAVVVLSLVLLGTIGTALAFLVAESEVVTNTFTYGKIELELWENLVDEDGELTEDKTYEGIEYLNIVPGDTVNKNPTATVKAGSEDCYVYVRVENNLVSTAVNAVNPVATLDIKPEWEKIGADGDTVTLYRYTADPQQPGDFNVFEHVTFSADLTVEDVATLKDIQDAIVIKAYAHQSDNTDVATADAAAIAWAGVTASN